MNQDHSSLPVRQQILISLQQPLVQHLLLFLTILCVFVPTFTYIYVWDDWSGIATNESLRHWNRFFDYFTDPNTFMRDPAQQLRDEWRPLRNVYFLITYTLHGLHPAGWRFQHVLLHCTASLIVLAFFHRIYRFKLNLRSKDSLPVPVQIATWTAVCAWAIHPANTEVTAWLKSADDVLAIILTFSALIILFPVDGMLTYKRAIFGPLVFALAFLAKESIAPIPAIYPLMALLLTPAPGVLIRHKPFWLATALLFVALIVYMILRTILLGKLEQVPYMAGSFSLMMATMTTAVVRYLQLTFWPFWPTVQIGDYAGWPLITSWSEPEVVTSLCLIGVALTIVVVLVRRSRLISAGVVLCILAFTPVANIIPMMQVMAERFMYFPLIGVAISLSAVLAHLLQRMRYFLTIPVVLIVALGFTTLKRLPVWDSNAAFQAANVHAMGNNYRAIYNNALDKAAAGNTSSSLAQLIVLQKDTPRDLYVAIAIAKLYFEMGHETTGSIYLDNVIRAFPTAARPLVLKADIQRLEGNTTATAFLYRKALEVEVLNHSMVHYFAGQTHSDIGETTSAIAYLNRAVELDEKNTSASLLLQQLVHE